MQRDLPRNVVPAPAGNHQGDQSVQAGATLQNGAAPRDRTPSLPPLALYEDTRLDARYGRYTNANLADYLVPVNADIGTIEVSAIDIPDYKLDTLGARGVGEIGITGTGAAVANAIFHATGKRVRDVPITPDKLIA